MSSFNKLNFIQLSITSFLLKLHKQLKFAEAESESARRRSWLHHALLVLLILVAFAAVAGFMQGIGRGGGASAPAASPTDAIQMDAQISTHCGVPYIASLLAFDPVQRLLAVATL